MVGGGGGSYHIAKRASHASVHACMQSTCLCPLKVLLPADHECLCLVVDLPFELLPGTLLWIRPGPVISVAIASCLHQNAPQSIESWITAWGGEVAPCARALLCSAAGLAP